MKLFDDTGKPTMDAKQAPKIKASAGGEGRLDLPPARSHGVETPAYSVPGR